MDFRIPRRSFLLNLISASGFVAGSTLSLGRRSSLNIYGINRADAQTKTPAKVKKIAVEEHFYSKEYLELLHSRTDWKSVPQGESAEKVLECGDARIKEMDECGIDMQIVSLSRPDLDPFKTEDAISVAKMMNDTFSELIKRYPKRFSAYCCLPLQDPDAAADELERAVTKLGLMGAMIDANNPDRWIADDKYEVIFEKLAKLDVPLYLHAGGPTVIDSGLHIVPQVMRIVNGNLLDKYPNLQIILGHAGESLPFWLNRLDGRWRYPDRPKTFSRYFKDNFYISTSSQCSPTLLNFLIAEVGSDRIMFAADYPYESSKQHVDFIDSAPISDSDREKICHLNAERLFKL